MIPIAPVNDCVSVARRLLHEERGASARSFHIEGTTLATLIPIIPGT
jgi:hypothetical protein